MVGLEAGGGRLEPEEEAETADTQEASEAEVSDAFEEVFEVDTREELLGAPSLEERCNFNALMIRYQRC